MKKIIIILLFIFVLPLFATEECKAPTDLVASVKNTQIFIGDIINYQISFKINEKDNLYIKKPDFAPFDLVKEEGNKVKGADGYLQVYNLHLSIFQVGKQKIPGFEVVIVSNDKQSCLKIPEKTIFVSSVMKDNQKKSGIRDIKGSVEVKEKTYLLVWAIITTILFILLIFTYRFFKYKKSTTVKEKIVKKIDPTDLAYKKLSKLIKDNLLKDGLIKDYYFRLSEIIREYLGGVYEFDSVEMTVDELKLQISNINSFKDENREMVNNFLDDTDFVKFSKFIPDSEEIERVTNIAFKIIEDLSLPKEDA